MFERERERVDPTHAVIISRPAAPSYGEIDEQSIIEKKAISIKYPGKYFLGATFTAGKRDPRQATLAESPNLA